LTYNKCLVTNGLTNVTLIVSKQAPSLSLSFSRSFSFHSETLAMVSETL
jgi:hypothetical protein